MESTANVVPWFLKNMPAAYFNQVSEDFRKQHLKAIQALRDLKQSDLSLKIVTKGENGLTEITYINTSSKKELLFSQIESLVVPENSSLYRVKVFTSLDGSLSLNVFSFQDINSVKGKVNEQDVEHITGYINELQDKSVPTNQPVKIPTEKELKDYWPRLTPLYVQTVEPHKFLVQKELFDKVRGTESSTVHVELYDGVEAASSQSHWVTIASANVLPEVLLRLSSSMISSYGGNIVRAHLDTVQDKDNATPDVSASGYVTMLRLLVDLNEVKDDKLPQLVKDLKRAKWLDESVTDLGLVRYPDMGLGKAEVIIALCSMLHGPLSKIDNQSYSSVRTILETLYSKKQYIQTAESIAQLLLDRFNPASPSTNEEFEHRANELNAFIKQLHNEQGRVLLLKLLEAAKSVLRTNFYNENRYALSLRVKPSIMVPPESGKPMPFGVFFIHGRHFNAFHCRFRDIARGGLRLVTPPNPDQFVLEGSRQFDEAYGLSYAQQLKNKDIPEGGAKGVILINTPAITAQSRFFAVRKSVKAFTDSLLDLMVKDSLSGLVDHYGKDELVYLGPDEQVIGSDIEWIITRAGQRGYPTPDAFMSSKRDNGINHKEFGVTSEGIVVYLDVALRNVLNIDPTKSPFTLKITGGPDGDVAGNLMKILFRDYGTTNPKVVGIADGFGVAEDPNGLDPHELLRLIDLSLPITSFDRTKLSPSGIMLDISTEEGLTRRLTMPFRVKADAFVPAGGRPNTINGDNWRNFLDENGVPSSKLIVEGANIFNTQEARENLFNQAGVVIVKDSSANKCGVITSSMEVAGSMLLSKQEFMAIKKPLVEDVVKRLRVLARLEAELLFRAYRNYPGALPHFSERISEAIGKVTDAITDALADVQPADPLFKELLPLIRENLPEKLAEVAWERVPSRYPVQYQRNAIASTLASKLVYQEGIHLVESQPMDRIAERAFTYYRQDLAMNTLVNELNKGDKLHGMTKQQKSAVLDLLKKGGARTAMGIF